PGTTCYLPCPRRCGAREAYIPRTSRIRARYPLARSTGRLHRTWRYQRRLHIHSSRTYLPAASPGSRPPDHLALNTRLRRGSLAPEASLCSPINSIPRRPSPPPSASHLDALPPRHRLHSGPPADGTLRSNYPTRFPPLKWPATITRLGCRRLPSATHARNRVQPASRLPPPTQRTSSARIALRHAHPQFACVARRVWVYAGYARLYALRRASAIPGHEYPTPSIFSRCALLTWNRRGGRRPHGRCSCC
ncbi:hypothetical protein C8R44DRAFT_858148, partial [Mycena epipterygia]